MGEGLRQSMNWLHTWAGVVLGALLFAIFWMGTLSVFDKEIDQWMRPETRIVVPEHISLDALRPVVAAEIGAQTDWGIILPDARSPAGGFGGIFYTDDSGERVRRPVDFNANLVLPPPQSLAGTGFIFPFHFGLHLNWQQLGYWLVGLAGMAMLVLLVSGVIIHRKIFMDFFTFRKQHKLPRSSLDLHNLSGVLGLPFHFVMTLSGLFIFFSTYFPQAPNAAYADEEEPAAVFSEEVFGGYSREPAGEPAPRKASLDAMMARARAAWDGGEPWIVSVTHAGDANGYVQVRRKYPNTVTRGRDTIWFDAVTGEELHRFSEGPVKTVQSWFLGLHFIQFDHWPLRWLYFALGLSGCVMIATGYIYWLETRRKRHAKQGLPGVRIVEGLTVGAVTGIIIATLTFFVANRLLPLGATFAGYERAALEVWAFYLVWLATFAHAWLRPGRTWCEQCGAVAVLALLAPMLNWVTTGDHLLKTLGEGYWPVAGMDLLLLAVAVVAVWTTRKLARRQAEVMAGRAELSRAGESQHG